MTTLSAPRFRLALAALFCAGVALTMLLLGGVAHAATPDPIDAAQAGVDTAWSSIELYGPLWGGALLAFAGVGAFLRRNESKHWIAQGRVLAVITTASMLLAAALTWKFRGGNTAGLLMSLYAAIVALIHPTVATPAPSSSASQAGFARLPLLAAIALTGALGIGIGASCTKLEHAATALVDCTGGSPSGILTEVLETLAAWSKPIADGGCHTDAGYDRQCLEDKALAKGLTVGGCALAELSTSQPATAGLRAVDPVKVALEHFRSSVAGGATFRTAHGDL